MTATKNTKDTKGDWGWRLAAERGNVLDKILRYFVTFVTFVAIFGG